MSHGWLSNVWKLSLQLRYDGFHMHKTIKEIQNTSKQHNTGITVDNEGQILTGLKTD